MASFFREGTGSRLGAGPQSALHERLPLARSSGLHLEHHSPRQPFRNCRAVRQDAAACSGQGLLGAGDPHATAPGQAPGCRGDRGDLRVRDRRRACGGRGPFAGGTTRQGVGPHDVLEGTQRLRGARRRAAAERRRGHAHVRWAELGRPPGRRAAVPWSRACRADRGRRPSRARGGGAAAAARCRCAGRGFAGTRGRCLAHPLPRTRLAQPGGAQPLALPAVPAELAKVFAQGHGGPVAGNLCSGHGVQCLDRNHPRVRHLRRKEPGMASTGAPR